MDRRRWPECPYLQQSTGEWLSYMYMYYYRLSGVHDYNYILVCYLYLIMVYEYYYSSPLVPCSLTTMHVYSTITAWTQSGEVDAFRNMLTQVTYCT